MHREKGEGRQTGTLFTLLQNKGNPDGHSHHLANSMAFQQDAHMSGNFKLFFTRKLERKGGDRASCEPSPP